MLRVIRFLNGLITFAVIVVLTVSAAYAGYSLWDNQQVYDAVENTMDEMRAIRAQIDLPKTQTGMAALIASRPTAAPVPDPAVQTAAPLPSETNPPDQPDQPITVLPAAAEGQAADPETEEKASRETPVNDTAATDAETVTGKQDKAATDPPAAVPTEEPADDSPFGQLRAINPDITAWIMMPGTAIDYPVLQGSSNQSYINKDVYGEFALAGSIFLDYRNDKNYQDRYSLIYGHDMSKHRMFSDINLYKDEDFFKENHLGILLTPDGNHLLQSIACVVTPAGNSSLFNPDNWNGFTSEQILEAVQEDAVFINPEGLEALKERLGKDDENPEDPSTRVVALSTCSAEYTDARTILLTLMDP